MPLKQCFVGILYNKFISVCTNRQIQSTTRVWNLKVNPCKDSLNILLTEQVNVMILPSSCFWCMTLMCNFSVSWHISHSLLKESSPRTSSDRIYICHSYDLRHQWLYKWITPSQSKTLTNQGSGNVTKKICSGELMTKRLEDREPESDLLVS